MKLLSICIPTYNRKNLVENQVRFFINETRTNDDIEIIVSDNASTDGTYEYLNSLFDDPKLTLSKNDENLGLVGNIRFLSELAQGKYLWFVGDDDVIQSGTLDKIYRIVSSSDAGHIFINHRVCNANGVMFEKIYSSDCNKRILDIEDMVSSFETGFGPLMFLTANIYLRELVLEANQLADLVNEGYSLALPLGYSYYCSKKGRSLIVTEPLVDNIWGNNSWESEHKLVIFRDMIAILDKFSMAIDEDDEMSRFLLEHLPAKHPEYSYIPYLLKYRRDNYALKWYLKKHRDHLIPDLLETMKDLLQSVVLFLHNHTVFRLEK